LGGGVITQTAAGTKTAGDNPDGVQLNPQLRKAAVSLSESEQECSGQKRGDLNYYDSVTRPSKTIK